MTLTLISFDMTNSCLPFDKWRTNSRHAEFAQMHASVNYNLALKLEETILFSACV